jgi:hypothetical protein
VAHESRAKGSSRGELSTKIHLHQTRRRYAWWRWILLIARCDRRALVMDSSDQRSWSREVPGGDQLPFGDVRTVELSW